MSGGSFDYLYGRPLGDVIESSNFDRMADAIAEYPDGQRAALELRSIRSAFDALADRWAALERVMRAVARDHSGDSGPEDVAIELAKYNATAATPSDPERPRPRCGLLARRGSDGEAHGRTQRPRAEGGPDETR